MKIHNSLLSDRRLLVADDEQFSLFFVVRMLRELGCTSIGQAANGAEALQHLQAGKADLQLVILDFNMPEANGLQVLKLIRTGKAGVPRDIDVLMLTGNSDFALVGAAMALDVDAFLIKPVSLVTLTARLEKILSETRDIKPADVYEGVDVATIGDRLLSHKPVGKPRPRSDKQKAPLPNGIRVRLDTVEAGAVLSEHIRGPGGELLIGAATVLTERLLLRLQELQDATKIEYIYIFQDSKKNGI
jgi:CheY-like chemotaxis protein